MKNVYVILDFEEAAIIRAFCQSHILNNSDNKNQEHVKINSKIIELKKKIESVIQHRINLEKLKK